MTMMVVAVCKWFRDALTMHCLTYSVLGSIIPGSETQKRNTESLWCILSPPPP